MWVVKRCGFYGMDGNFNPQPHMIVSKFFVGGFTVSVELEDTETKDKASLKLTSTDDVDILVGQYSPYGCCFMRSDSIGGGNYVLIPIDNMSYKFLDYVENVREVTIPAESILYKDVTSQFQEVKQLDSMMTLFHVEPRFFSSQVYLGTLFNIICVSKSGWRGSKFYLMKKKLPVSQDFNGIGMVAIAYQVEFNSLEKARSLIARAALAGINPDAFEEEALGRLHYRG